MRRLLVKDTNQDGLYNQYLEFVKAVQNPDIPAGEWFVSLDLIQSRQRNNFKLNSKIQWENYVVGVATCQLNLGKLKMSCDTMKRQKVEFKQLKEDLGNFIYSITTVILCN